MFKILKNLLSKNTSEIEDALQKGAVIIDVRTASEFNQGHIPGSKNIPLFEIKQETEQIKNWKKPVITVCASGSRSALAKSALVTAGVEVYNGGSWSHLNTLIV